MQRGDLIAPFKLLLGKLDVEPGQFFFLSEVRTPQEEDKSKLQVNPRAAGGWGIKLPPLRFVVYLRNLMSYERETWHSFK